MKKIFLSLFLILSATSLFAAVHYVSSTGSATWANSTNISTPCSLATANTNAAAGDTVYLRSGTYSGITGAAISPVNTGTAGNVITFSSYNNEDVQLVGSGTSSFAVDLDSEYGTVRSYIKVHDLHFTGFMIHAWIRKGDHNEISYCSFIGYPAGATLYYFQGWWSASYICHQATHNWVHHSTFGTWGICDPYGTDCGVVFQCGLESDAADNTQYNTVEDCEFYQGGHHVVSFNGKFNIYRRNYLHNEPWYPIGSPVYATRTFFQTGVDTDGCYNLVESSRIGYGGPKNKIEIGGAGGTMAGANNIWRNNVFLQIYTDAMYFQKYEYQTDVKYNHVYNNTYWHGGYGTYQRWPDGTAPSPYWGDCYTHGMLIDEGNGSGLYGNVFKNNLFYQNKDVYGGQYSIIEGTTLVAPVYQVISNNWLDNAGDPKFVDITGTPDPTNATQFNFTLQGSSPCIDVGGSLTLASGSGSGSTALIVDDAGYFQDGSWGSSLSARNADWIAIGTVGNVAQISSINYATNTITLASPMTWADNAPIWLYKDSAGTQVLYGAAPDIGALEYIEGMATPTIKIGPGSHIRVKAGGKIVIK